MVVQVYVVVVLLVQFIGQYCVYVYVECLQLMVVVVQVVFGVYCIEQQLVMYVVGGGVLQCLYDCFVDCIVEYQVVQQVYVVVGLVDIGDECLQGGVVVVEQFNCVVVDGYEVVLVFDQWYDFGGGCVQQWCLVQWWLQGLFFVDDLGGFGLLLYVLL